MSEGSPKSLTLQELPDVRRKTEGVAKFLQQQLSGHLEVLRPLLAADRLLGRYSGGKEEVAGADRALSELQQQYKQFTAKPFDLPLEFDMHWLTLVGTRLELYPWEYTHEVKTDRESKTITMTSSVRWILSYSSNYTMTQAREVLSGKEQRRPEYVRQFVVNALIMQLVVRKNPGLAQLFADLRYELKVVPAPDLKGLPLATITSSLPSFRPADDLILAAVAFSGVPAFIELIDVD